MSVKFIQPNIPPGLYGVAALQMMAQLMRTLEANGAISASDRSAIYRGTIEVLQPANQEPMKSLRELLQAMSGDTPPASTDRPN